MSTGSTGKPAQLTLHHDRVEARLQRIGNGTAQGAN
jgi:hypothetical protein